MNNKNNINKYIKKLFNELILFLSYSLNYFRNATMSEFKVFLGAVRSGLSMRGCILVQWCVQLRHIRCRCCF